MYVDVSLNSLNLLILVPFFEDSSGLLFRRSRHLQMQTVYFSLFRRLPFVSFSCLTALPETSVAAMDGTGEGERPRLVPSLRGKTWGQCAVSRGFW